MFRFHAISRLEGSDLDGIHLLWSPPVPSGHSLDGFTIFRRHARGEKSEQCTDLSPEILAEARAQGVLPIPDAMIWADVKDPSDPASSIWTFRIELTGRHSVLTITANAALAAFAGTPDGTVLTGAAFNGGPVTFRGSGMGIVWVVTDSTDTQGHQVS